MDIRILLHYLGKGFCFLGDMGSLELLVSVILNQEVNQPRSLLLVRIILQNKSKSFNVEHIIQLYSITKVNCSYGVQEKLDSLDLGKELMNANLE